jgi:hypothetical protein
MGVAPCSVKTGHLSSFRHPSSMNLDFSNLNADYCMRECFVVAFRIVCKFAPMVILSDLLYANPRLARTIIMISRYTHQGYGHCEESAKGRSDLRHKSCNNARS